MRPGVSEGQAIWPTNRRVCVSSILLRAIHILQQNNQQTGLRVQAISTHEALANCSNEAYNDVTLAAAHKKNVP